MEVQAQLAVDMERLELLVMAVLVDLEAVAVKVEVVVPQHLVKVLLGLVEMEMDQVQEAVRAEWHRQRLVVWDWHRA
jgi:hypothetical protein